MRRPGTQSRKTCEVTANSGGKDVMAKSGDATVLSRRWITLAAVLVVALLAMPAVLHLTKWGFSRSVVSAAPQLNKARHLHKASPRLSPSPAASTARDAAATASSRSAPSRTTGTTSKAENTTATRAFSEGSMSTQKLRYRDPIVFNARDKHTGTIIMLHGLGDSGDGWAPVGAEWAPDLKHCKFIFPHAPNRPITVNFGMSMPGWYDIASLEDINQREDKDGLHESQRYIESLVEAEVAAGVPSHRVVVAGFSQGGAVAMLMLRSKHKLAGVVGLSTYLPLRKEPPLISEANMKTPIFQAHGDMDYTVAYKYGVETHNLLKELGADITFKTYNGMAHSAVPQEIADVGAFLKRVSPPN